METFTLQATKRTKTGNGPARALRREGRIPAVLYGPKTEPLKLAVSSNELHKIIKKSEGAHFLLNLVVEDGDGSPCTVMVKDLAVQPVKREMLHVDFYEFDVKQKVRVDVPVITTGHSVGVEKGGTIQIVRRELEVLCYPNKIPSSIEIDISDLDMGDAVHIEDVPAEEGVEFPFDVNFTVITCVSPMREEEPEEEEVEEGLEGEVLETETSEPVEESEE